MNRFFSGFLQGALAYGAVYMIGIALGWEWTLFGFDRKDVVASAAGLGTWNYFRNRAKNRPEATGGTYVAKTATVVLVILAVVDTTSGNLQSRKSRRLYRSPRPDSAACRWP